MRPRFSRVKDKNAKVYAREAALSQGEGEKTLEYAYMRPRFVLDQWTLWLHQHEVHHEPTIVLLWASMK